MNPEMHPDHHPRRRVVVPSTDPLAAGGSIRAVARSLTPLPRQGETHLAVVEKPRHVAYAYRPRRDSSPAVMVAFADKRLAPLLARWRALHPVRWYVLTSALAGVLAAALVGVPAYLQTGVQAWWVVLALVCALAAGAATYRKDLGMTALVAARWVELRPAPYPLDRTLVPDTRASRGLRFTFRHYSPGRDAGLAPTYHGQWEGKTSYACVDSSVGAPFFYACPADTDLPARMEQVPVVLDYHRRCGSLGDANLPLASTAALLRGLLCELQGRDTDSWEVDPDTDLGLAMTALEPLAHVMGTSPAAAADTMYGDAPCALSEDLWASPMHDACYMLASISAVARYVGGGRSMLDTEIAVLWATLGRIVKDIALAVDDDGNAPPAYPLTSGELALEIAARGVAMAVVAGMWGFAWKPEWDNPAVDAVNDAISPFRRQLRAALPGDVRAVLDSAAHRVAVSGWVFVGSGE